MNVDQKILKTFFNAIPAGNKDSITFDEFEHFFKNEYQDRQTSIIQKIESNLKASTHPDLQALLTSKGARTRVNLQSLQDCFQQISFAFSPTEIRFLVRQKDFPLSNTFELSAFCSKIFPKQIEEVIEEDYGDDFEEDSPKKPKKVPLTDKL